MTSKSVFFICCVGFRLQGEVISFIKSSHIVGKKRQTSGIQALFHLAAPKF